MASLLAESLATKDEESSCNSSTKSDALDSHSEISDDSDTIQPANAYLRVRIKAATAVVECADGFEK